MSCFEDVETEDITTCVNQEVQAGLSEVGLKYVKHEDVVNFPMPVALGEVGYDYEKSVTVAEDITFTAGKGWAKMDFQPDTGEGTVELVGNKGNKKTKNGATFFIPGNHKKILGYIKTMKNVPSLYMYKERDGQVRIVGDKNNPAFITEAKATTGKGGEDDKGVQITVESYGIPIVYEGVIQLKVVTP
ncbi:hypothetical protein AB9T89_10375 [Flavobacterium oncorhynchi]|uniref:hypothetical protein n=1 Tax=Flavobacterium oncorhynchi TaxID=728056 RepID=UPI00351A3178